MDELAFYTNEELIKELFQRKTFVGVLITSADQHVQDSQVHDHFSAYITEPLTNEQVVKLVDSFVENLRSKT